MKRVLTFILVLSMILGSIGAVFAAPALEDVIDTVYEDAVIRLASLGILEGYPDGTFKPDNTITRAEYAAAVIRAKGLEYAALASVGATSFSDVPATHWAAGYINVAAKAGFINGMGDGTYAPEAPITYEQAVTLVTRALGYEPAAQSKGGYPYGYLIVAAENGLLEKVRGTQGEPAPRGLVAQLLDNALEIPLMIQIGYGDQTRWVVSGTSDTDEKTILDDMGFVSIKGRITDIARTSSLKKNQIRIDGKDKGTYKVIGDVDYEAIFGAEVKAWVNDDDEIVFVKIESDVLFDAVKMDGKKLKLVDADDKYELPRGAQIYVDGKQVDELDTDEYDYAKVVLDDDGDVAFIDAYRWVDFLVVEEVDGNYVYGYGDEVNAKDFTIVKDGRTIGLDDLEEGDIFFYTKAEDGYAEVFNDYVEGEIERIYDSSIKVEGKEYEVDGVKYINQDGDIDTLVEKTNTYRDVAEAMQDAGKVAVFLNRAGDMKFLSGDVDDLTTSSSYAFVHSAANAKHTVRTTEYWALDVVNAEGKLVEYDIKAKDVKDDEDGILFKEVGGRIAWDASELNKKVVEISLDNKGNVDKILILDENGANNEKTSAKYISGYKINSDATVFLNEKYVSSNKSKDIDTDIWNKLDFEKINTGSAYVKDDKVVAFVVEDSDRGTGDEYLTVATADADKVARKDIYKLSLIIDGKKVEVDTEDGVGSSDDAALVKKGDLLEVTFDKKNEKITDVESYGNAISSATGISGKRVKGLVSKVNTSKKSLEIGDDPYKLGVDAVIVDATDKYKVISLSNLKDGDMVAALLIEENSVYAEVIVKTGKAGSVVIPPGPTGVVTYINADGMLLIDGEDYQVGAATVLYNEKGTVIAVGATAIEKALAQNDEVKDVKVENGVVKSLVGTKVASEIEALGTLIADIDALAQDGTADTTSARTAYDALTNSQKDLVTNYAKLVSAEAAVAKKAAETLVHALFVDHTADSLVLAAGVDQDQIDAAQVAVNKVAAADKAALQTLVDAAQALFNLDAAETLVHALFVDHTADSLVLAAGVDQDQIDAAQVAVNKVAAADKAALQTLVDAAQELLDIDEAETALAAADTTLKMRNFLEKYADVIGIDVTDAKYVANKDTVANEVLAATPTTLDAVKTAFNDALDLL
jgi:hypothetical protein